MTWLSLIFAVELGFQAQGIKIDNGPGAIYQVASPYTQLEGGVAIGDALEIGGSARILVDPYSPIAYIPYDARYLFWARLYVGFFELGWEHECWHPNLSPQRPDVGYLYGGIDRLYVRLENRRIP